MVLGVTRINVTSTAYPPELRDRATSLETELGRAVDRAALCARNDRIVGGAVRRRLLAALFDAILDALACQRLGQPRRACAGNAGGFPIGHDGPASTTGGRWLVRVGVRVERSVAARSSG